MKLDFDKLTTPDMITAAISEVHSRASTVQMDIHRILNAVAKQWHACGDVRPAVDHVNSLLNDMPAGVRSNGVRKWVEVFFGFIVVAEGDTKGQFVSGKMKHTDLLMEKVQGVTWWTFAPEPPYKPLDFAAEFERLVKKATDRADKTTTGDVIPKELLAGCKTLLASIKEPLTTAPTTAH